MKVTPQIRVSYGSAVKLGLIEGRLDGEPTTLYLMTYTPGRCSANCSFCTQARESKTPVDKLSRVSWPPFPLTKVLDKLNTSQSFKRICIQALNYPNLVEDLIHLTKKFKTSSPLPLSISCQPLTRESMEILYNLGVDRISISLDAASEKLFTQWKGGKVNSPYTWTMHLDNLGKAVEIFGKGKVTTHLIIGLGETDSEMLTLIQKLTDIGIIPSLFAFTPVKGTLLEDRTSPPIERYRTLQLCRYLIVKRKIRLNNLSFKREGKLSGITMVWDNLKKNITARSKIFTTVGCPDCNRPYYTERPSGPLYNYPRPLSESEVIDALNSIRTYLS